MFTQSNLIKINYRLLKQMPRVKVLHQLLLKRRLVEVRQPHPALGPLFQRVEKQQKHPVVCHIVLFQILIQYCIKNIRKNSILR